MNQSIVPIVLFSLLLGFVDVPERTVDPKLPISEKLPDLSGPYSFTGTENGKPYKGVLLLTGEPPAYRVVWAIEDGETFRGTALHDGDVLAVGWSVAVGEHPSRGVIMKQGVNLFRKEGENWRGRWTTGERVGTEEWKLLAR